MNISTISFGNLRRRKGKTALLGAGLTIGVAMVVAMMGITMALQSDLEKKLDEYGANIVVVPRSETISLSSLVICVCLALLYIRLNFAIISSALSEACFIATIRAISSCARDSSKA